LLYFANPGEKKHIRFLEKKFKIQITWKKGTDSFSGDDGSQFIYNNYYFFSTTSSIDKRQNENQHRVFMDSLLTYSFCKNKSPGISRLSCLREHAGVTALFLFLDFFLFSFDGGFLFGSAQAGISDCCNKGQ